MKPTEESQSTTMTEAQVGDSFVATGWLAHGVMRAQVYFSFAPQTDITAYELAQLLPYFHGQPMYEEDFVALGTVARHLKR